MADLRKYRGDTNPTREAVHIESNRVEQDIRQLNAKRHIVKGQADPGIQAMKPVKPGPTIGPHYARRIGGEERRLGSAERLRGDPEGIRVLAPEEYPFAPEDFGTRVDGTPKGLGFFGVLARTDEPEMISTELSTSITVNGEKILFPLIVPSLTAEEIAHLVDGGEPTKAIVEKAFRHAEQRRADGKSPFAETGEQVALPKSGDAEMREGFNGVETLRTGEMLGYQKRDKLFPKEEELFKANPHVGGMAAEDNRVILNPYSTLKPQEQQWVATLEATRLFMREHKITPTFELTNEQRAFFKGTPYEKDDVSAKQSILSRIFVGDPSAGTLTPEQKAAARDVMRQMRARGVTK